jgi:hypothetical protein
MDRLLPELIEIIIDNVDNYETARLVNHHWCYLTDTLVLRTGYRWKLNQYSIRRLLNRQQSFELKRVACYFINIYSYNKLDMHRLANTTTKKSCSRKIYNYITDQTNTKVSIEFIEDIVSYHDYYLRDNRCVYIPNLYMIVDSLLRHPNNNDKKFIQRSYEKTINGYIEHVTRVIDYEGKGKEILEDIQNYFKKMLIDTPFKN